MPNVATAVIEQEVVSINLKNGLGEQEEPSSIDWTQFMTKADNCDFRDIGVIKKRPGTSIIQNGSSGLGYHLVELPDGIGSVDLSGQLRHLNEAVGTFQVKGTVGTFKVETQTIASNRNVSSATAVDVSTLSAFAITDKYRVVAYQGPTRVSGSNPVYDIVLQDIYSNNIVRRWTYTAHVAAPSLRMVSVDGSILHVYVSEESGGLTAGIFFRIDTNALPSNGTLTPTTVTLTSTQVIVDVVALPGSSVVVHFNGVLERFNTAGTSTQTGTATITTTQGIATNGSDLFIVGRNATNQVLKTLNSSFATTRTALSGLIANSVSRVAVDPVSNTCMLLIYRAVPTTSTVAYPMATLYRPTAAATTLTSIRDIRGWCEASLPFWSPSSGSFYVAMSSKMSGNSGASPSNDTIGNACCLINLGSLFGDQREPVAVLGGYNTSISFNADSGSILSPCYPHRPATDDTASGRLMYVCSTAVNSTGSIAIDVNKIYLYKPSGISSVKNVVGGACVNYYDGDAPTELGWVNGVSCFVTSSGAGTVPAGVRSYCVVFEYKHMDGTSRFSRTSRPSSIVLGSANNVLVEAIPPDVTKDQVQTQSQKHVMNIYRTSAGGTEFYLVFSGSFSGSSQVYSYTDSMTDITLLSQPRLFRQPLIAGSPKDRYHALSTPCLIRHKDRLWYCNKSEVYFSSFDVDGETAWFNPEFKIPIVEGVGDIVGLASLNGSLVVFKENDVFIVDGDGPPENGGTGMEFSPPRRLQTEFGCIDQRSIIQAPDCVMFRTSRGIELLNRNMNIVFAGDRVSKITDAYPYTGGCTIDRSIGAALYVVGQSLSSLGFLTGTKIIAYNFQSNAWSTWTTSYDVQDLAYSKVTISGSEQKRVVLLASNSQLVTYLNPSIFQDNGASGTVYESISIETGSVRAGSLQDRILCTQLLLLVKNNTNHDIHISAAYDGSAVFEDEQVFEADQWVGQEIKQIIYQVVRTDLQSIRFRIVETAPSDATTYPVTTGEGPQILDLAVKVGKVGGGAQLGWESTINSDG